jgi:hypothetical protein
MSTTLTKELRDANLQPRRVSLRRSRMRHVKRICDVVHLVKDGPNIPPEDPNLIEMIRQDVIAEHHAEIKRKDTQAKDMMLQRLRAMGMKER